MTAPEIAVIAYVHTTPPRLDLLLFPCQPSTLGVGTAKGYWGIQAHRRNSLARLQLGQGLGLTGLSNIA